MKGFSGGRGMSEIELHVVEWTPRLSFDSGEFFINVCDQANTSISMHNEQIIPAGDYGLVMM